jgi:glutaredoxin
MLFTTILAQSSMVTSQAPLSAESVVRDALKQAAIEHKNVAVYFHASWCPWCKRLEKLWDSSRFGPKFSSSFVLAKIDIRERGELVKEENPGWEQEMLTLRGAPERDVPYLAILSQAGTKLVDSYRPTEGRIPGNAGYPKTPVEIDAFLALIAKAAPGFSSQDRTDLRSFFEAGPSPLSSIR